MLDIKFIQRRFLKLQKKRLEKEWINHATGAGYGGMRNYYLVFLFGFFYALLLYIPIYTYKGDSLCIFILCSMVRH
jgi:hypothetical protein